MSRTRKLILGAALAAGAAIVSAVPASATMAPPGGTPPEMLRQLCTQKGGTVFFSPYAVVRCQEARSNKGFDEERRICTDLVGSTFVSGELSRNRTAWQCLQP
jgi:hypothetical protein